MPYYSKRNKDLEEKLSDEFWMGFKAYIEEIAYEKGFFFENFGNWNGCSLLDSNKVTSKMLQEIGRQEWPLFDKPSDDQTFDLIQFFFNFVSYPTKWNYNRSYADCLLPTEVNTKKGRYDYTIGINHLFENFRHPYKLIKGDIKRFGSKILDEKILNLEFKIPDTELFKLINDAINYFYSRNSNDKKIGVEKIVDAYQRLKTIKNSNVKRGIELMKKEVSLLEVVQTAFGEDLADLWKVVNNYAIRHFETNKIPLKDENFMEYLFYGYFNVIRLILKKYGWIQDKEKSVVEKEEEEELPF